LAPAKLNLFLHIIGQRDDGYHELQTVFQLLDYADELRFHLLPTSQIRHVNLPPGVHPQTELCFRAADLLQTHTGCTSGVEITIQKRIPIGGGLGGGSSDAATTLLVLNELWDLHLSVSELAELGVQLGADVPVFVAGRSAWAEGVGEKLTPVDLPECWFLVVFPNIFVETRKIFMAPELTRNARPSTIADFLDHSGSCESDFGGNSCQEVVFQLYPEVAAAFDWLNQHASARLTGTGACLFARFSTEAEACNLLEQVPDKWQAFVAKGVNHVSELSSALERVSG
jgi:4-diphosphocytidyl-2-C-methyl-D-erythritol kinase